ncbi:uncharacterized protein [Hetaerina americana]|uniref:uncharacterized protein n=1 Tax=Hetaerina americana TaxID=62018 RepID=UPI003A7F2918
MGKSAYGVLRNLCAPEKPSGSSYGQLCEFLRRHFSPKLSVIAETHKFHQSVQGKTSSVREFAAELRKASRGCNFGAFLDRALRDQFILGLRDRDIVRALYLETEELGFERAVEIAAAREKAAANASACSLFSPSADHVTGVGACGVGVHFVKADTASEAGDQLEEQ